MALAVAGDTIFALSSGQGRAGVAVIRISGPAAASVLTAMCGSQLPHARRAGLRSIRDPMTREVLDRGLVLWFPGNAGFTGEPSAEFQVHGSRAVVASVLDALAGLDGCRAARPGEFTRRAFENGRLDLAQVEALDDLIAADTAMQRRQAMRGLEGRLGDVVRGWRKDLLMIRGLLAAEIDFSDEGDVGENASGGIDSDLFRLAEEMEEVLANGRRGRIVAAGYRVAILGKPNSGKSTLLNALSGSDAAIVSEFAGTTRDIIEVRLDWEGYEIVLTDTAGLRDTSDPVERIGVERARQKAQAADLCVFLDPDEDWSSEDGLDIFGASIRVRSKSDVCGRQETMPGVLRLSTVTGEGLGELRHAILTRVREVGQVEHILVTRDRQVAALRDAAAALRRASALERSEVELRDHEVRAAEASLDVLLGRIGVEEMLSAVFSRFCVGK
jgi:tRNA modification GTPase